MDADLRAALEKLVTAPGAMATDPDGDCYFCEADEDVGGDIEHEDWCLVPIARAALAAPAVTETDLRAAARHLSRVAGRYLAGDSDVQPDDVQSAIEEVRAALATDTEEKA